VNDVLNRVTQVDVQMPKKGEVEDERLGEEGEMSSVFTCADWSNEANELTVLSPIVFLTSFRSGLCCHLPPSRLEGA
jgi:hypothetical protein